MAELQREGNALIRHVDKYTVRCRPFTAGPPLPQGVLLRRSAGPGGMLQL